MPLSISYDTLPAYMQECMRAYIEEGQRPGDFLYYILINDFVHAALHADDINQEFLLQYAAFLYWKAPILCWGTAEKVSVWIQKGGIHGQTEAVGDQGAHK